MRRNVERGARTPSVNRSRNPKFGAKIATDYTRSARVARTPNSLIN